MLAVQGGLGYALWTAYQFSRLDLILAIATVGGLGLASDRLISLAARKALRWQVGVWGSELSATVHCLSEGLQELPRCAPGQGGACHRRHFIIRWSSMTSEPNIHRDHTGREFADMIVDQFEEMIEQSEQQPLVMSVALHPFVCGQPFRLRPLRQALKHCLQHKCKDEVWFTAPDKSRSTA
jgi:hypothetical protein